MAAYSRGSSLETHHPARLIHTSPKAPHKARSLHQRIVRVGHIAADYHRSPMTDLKPIPQVPAALCGLFPGAHADLAGNRYQATEEFEAGVWQFKYRTNHGVQHITMSCHDMALLLDSPLAMCHAARWLAGRLGYNPGETAPLWYWDTSSGSWTLEGGIEFAFWKARIPEISRNLSHSAALAAACVAVGGAK